MATVAITGASGFVGRALTHHLAVCGHEVLRCVRAPGRCSADEIGWDPATGELDRDAAARAHAFVHLAGENVAAHRWSAEVRQRIADSRGPATEHLCRTLAALPRPPALLSASATGYYGDRGDEVLDERSARGRGFLADVTTAWEAGTEPLQRCGARVAHLRIGVVLGRGGAIARMLPFFRLGLGGRLGNGRQYMSWIALEDLVRVVASLLSNDVSGPVNCVAPTPVTNREFTAALARALHRPAILPVPAAMLRLLTGSLADEALLASQRVVPRRLLELGHTFVHRDVASALQAAI